MQIDDNVVELDRTVRARRFYEKMQALDHDLVLESKNEGVILHFSDGHVIYIHNSEFWY